MWRPYGIPAQSQDTPDCMTHSAPAPLPGEPLTYPLISQNILKQSIPPAPLLLLPPLLPLPFLQFVFSSFSLLSQGPTVPSGTTALFLDVAFAQTADYTGHSQDTNSIKKHQGLIRNKYTLCYRHSDEKDCVWHVRILKDNRMEHFQIANVHIVISGNIPLSVLNKYYCHNVKA